MYALVENYNHQIHTHTDTKHKQTQRHRDTHRQMGAVLKPNERELV